MKPVPPPSAALADAVSRMQPVRTRSPARSILMLLLGLAAYSCVPLFVIFHRRADLAEQSLGWLVGVGLVWLLGLILPLAAVLLPTQGQVLPDGARALVAAVAAALALVVVSLVFPAEESQRSQRIPGLFGHCLNLAMAMAVLPFAATLMMVRRLAPVGSWRLGAALGAAGGALSGTLLHVLCAITSPWHVAAAHGGAVVLCAILGALVTPRVVE